MLCLEHKSFAFTYHKAGFLNLLAASLFCFLPGLRRFVVGTASAVVAGWSGLALSQVDVGLGDDEAS